MIDEILKRIRAELKISQETFARELNVSFTTLNRWGNNRSKPSRLAMLQIKEYATNHGVSDEIATALKDIK
jgi:DNA-binding transcriptional regulator YiaG